MIFSKGRIVGLFCTVGALVGATVILHEISADNGLDRLGSLWRVDVLLMLFLLYGAHFLAEPVRWTIYTRRLSEQGNATFSGILACFNITALLSYSLPFKLGLPLRLFLLAHFLHLDGKKVVGLMTLDGIFTLLCWALFSLLLFFLTPETTTFFPGYLVLLVFLLAACVLGGAGYWLIKKKGAQLLATLRAIPPGLIVLVIVTLVVDILLYGVRHMVLADILGVEIAAEKIFIIGILAVFAGIVSTLPMGLGAYDASLVALLALYGVDLETGLILALSNRLGMIITSIILGVPSSLAMWGKDVNIVKS